MNHQDPHPHSKKPAGDSLVPANAATDISVPQPLSPLAPASVPATSPLPMTPVESAIYNAIYETGRSISHLREALDTDTNLTGKQRNRLISAKSRNYGFISKTFDIARDNPAIRPPQFSIGDMANTLTMIEMSRQLMMVADQLRALADDFLLENCDTGYRFGLRIYGSLREQAHAKLAGADILFQELRQFFTLHRRGGSGEGEPTIHELDRDLHSMMHGHADGEIIIRNESPHKTGGVHEVIDDVHRHGRHDGAEIKVKE